MLYGEHSDIDSNDLDYGTHKGRKPRKSVALWSPAYEAQQHPDIHAKVQQKFKDLARKIRFQIYSGHISFEMGNLVVPFVESITSPGFRSWNTPKETNTLVFVGLEMMQPLLNNKLTVAERMMAIHQLTITVIHELVVSHESDWNWICDN